MEHVKVVCQQCGEGRLLGFSSHLGLIDRGKDSYKFIGSCEKGGVCGETGRRF